MTDLDLNIETEAENLDTEEPESSEENQDAEDTITISREQYERDQKKLQKLSENKKKHIIKSKEKNEKINEYEEVLSTMDKRLAERDAFTDLVALYPEAKEKKQEIMEMYRNKNLDSMEDAFILLNKNNFVSGKVKSTTSVVGRSEINRDTKDPVVKSTLDKYIKKIEDRRNRKY